MRYVRFSITSLLALAACLFAQTGSRDRIWLTYEPTVVELAGKLTVQLKYGPPNFGETPKIDQKVKVPILLLPYAVNVRGDPKSDLNAESVEGARQIQLVFGTKISYQQLIGKQVVVKGTLFRSHTGHHYTDVLMNVSDINGKKHK